jgi:hypothetical protein
MARCDVTLGYSDKPVFEISLVERKRGVQASFQLGIDLNDDPTGGPNRHMAPMSCDIEHMMPPHCQLTA